MLRKTLLTLATVTSAFSFAPAYAEGEVNVYSYRQQFLVEPLLQAFTNKTGIKVNIVYSNKGLLERLEQEGRNSPADVMLTPDIGPMYDGAEKGLFATIDSATIERNVPEHFQDSENRWVGLTSRARVIYTSKERVKEGEIKTYEDLADPKWKGRVCTRSGKHTYNISLIASMIAHDGLEATETWLRGVKDNLGQKPQGNDRAQAKAIKEGICDVALGNSYYFGHMLTNEEEPEQKTWAEAINLVFPNQDGRGAHMNISGASITKYAPHPQEALELIEFLTERDAQYLYANANFEFPVRPKTKRSDIIKKYMGDFKGDEINLTEVGALRKEAAKLVDKVGFDN